MHRVVCARLQLDLSQASDALLAYLASTWCVNTAVSYSIADYLNDRCPCFLIQPCTIYMLSCINQFFSRLLPASPLFHSIISNVVLSNKLLYSKPSHITLVNMYQYFTYNITSLYQAYCLGSKTPSAFSLVCSFLFLRKMWHHHHYQSRDTTQTDQCMWLDMLTLLP